MGRAGGEGWGRVCSAAAQPIDKNPVDEAKTRQNSRCGGFFFWHWVPGPVFHSKFEERNHLVFTVLFQSIFLWVVSAGTYLQKSPKIFDGKTFLAPQGALCGLELRDR